MAENHMGTGPTIRQRIFSLGLGLNVSYWTIKLMTIRPGREFPTFQAMEIALPMYSFIVLSQNAEYNGDTFLYYMQIVLLILDTVLTYKNNNS